MKILLKEIAKQAGVSEATVSRVINKTVPVSPAMEQRVFDAVQTLGADLSANKIKRNRTGDKPLVIGLIVSDLSNPFFEVVMRGVVSEAQFYDYGVQIFETNEDLATENRIFELIPRFQLGGLIICASGVSDSKLIDFFTRTKIPLVVLNRLINYPQINCITIDHHKAMYQAAMHLINLGHKRIAYLSGPSKREPSISRGNGIREALKQSGLELSSELCVSSFPNEEGGFHAMISLLALPKAKRPTGVIAFNDLIALGAMRAIRTKNLRIPEDISVVGNDNIEMAIHCYPALTTISPPKNHLGKLAVQTINSVLQNHGKETPNGFIQIEAPLTLRYSTGVAPN